MTTVSSPTAPHATSGDSRHRADPAGPWSTTDRRVGTCSCYADVALHRWATPQRRLVSAGALVLVALTAGITVCVHVVMLTVGRQADAACLFSEASPPPEAVE
ncbi:MAG: hypothetical protein M3Y71_11120 [Actinomycetota bacterium]|nr:hypothetical protein [Actinomycetota bacterium]